MGYKYTVLLSSFVIGSLLKINSATWWNLADVKACPSSSLDSVLFSLRVYMFLYCAMEKAMAPHSSTLAWKIPWMEGPGGLQSMGSLGVGYDWATSLSLFTFMHWRREWQPTPVFLLGESQGWGAWWAAVYGVAQSQTWLKQLSSSSSRAWSIVAFHWLSCGNLSLAEL